MKAGIIAAGHGERLARAGVRDPKPLVCVAGVPLIDHTLNGIRAAGISDVVCIINEASTAVADYCREHVRDLSLQFIQRTTPSSMESLFTLAPLLGSDWFLLLTVDAIVAPAALRSFVAETQFHPDADGVLAVSTFIDDEKPLRVAYDSAGRVTAIGAGAEQSGVITAGFYCFRSTIFAEIAAARNAQFTALRQFLAHLVARGYVLYAAPVSKTVDVDRPEDIATAEAFIRGGYAA